MGQTYLRILHDEPQMLLLPRRRTRLLQFRTGGVPDGIQWLTIADESGWRMPDDLDSDSAWLINCRLCSI
jgi:hypothetical protein